jgi:hypothetical protein
MRRVSQAEFRFLARFLSWLVQLMAASLPILVCLVVAKLAALIAPWIDESMNTTLGFYLCAAVPSWILSCLLAIGIRRTSPASVAVGRRIWVLPATLMVLGFCWDAVSISRRFAFVEFFSIEHHRAVFLLITHPTLSAMAYSLGMIWSTRRQASKAPATRNSGPDDASGVTLSSSL